MPEAGPLVSMVSTTRQFGKESGLLTTYPTFASLRCSDRRVPPELPAEVLGEPSDQGRAYPAGLARVRGL
jgi:hypothetical protein